MKCFGVDWVQLVTGLPTGFDLSSLLLVFLLQIVRRMGASPKVPFQDKATLESAYIMNCLF